MVESILGTQFRSIKALVAEKFVLLHGTQQMWLGCDLQAIAESLVDLPFTDNEDQDSAIVFLRKGRLWDHAYIQTDGGGEPENAGVFPFASLVKAQATGDLPFVGSFGKAYNDISLASWPADNRNRGDVIGDDESGLRVSEQTDIGTFLETLRTQASSKFADELIIDAESHSLSFHDETAQRQRERTLALGRIAALAGYAERIKTDLDDAVTSAVDEHKASWRDVGLAVGIGAQAAQRRWDADARRKHTEYERARRAESRTSPPEKK